MHVCAQTHSSRTHARTHTHTCTHTHAPLQVRALLLMPTTLPHAAWLSKSAWATVHPSPQPQPMPVAGALSAVAGEEAALGAGSNGAATAAAEWGAASRQLPGSFQAVSCNADGEGSSPGAGSPGEGGQSASATPAQLVAPRAHRPPLSLPLRRWTQPRCRR
jgi:hypothetical protein